MLYGWEAGTGMEIAKALYRMGLDLDVIEQITNVSPEDLLCALIQQQR